MPVYAQYTTFDWYDQYNNLLDFSDTTDSLKTIRANALDGIRFEGNLRIFQRIETSEFYLKNDSITSTGTDFSEITVGDICRIVFENNQSIDMTFEVESVSDDIVYFTNVTGTPPIGFDEFYNISDQHYIFIETPLTYCKYQWGLSQNDGSKNTSSRLDGQTQTFEVKDIGLGDPRATTPSLGVQNPINSSKTDLEVSFVGNSQVPFGNSGSFNSAQDYSINHTFVFDDLNENDYQDVQDNNILDRFLGESCLDYFSRLEFRTVESNPETSRVAELDFKGDTGLFQESFNQGRDKFSISNVTYTLVNGGDAIEAVSSVKNTNVTFTVTSTENSFTDPVAVVSHKTLLTEDEYRNEPVHYEYLFNYDAVRLTGTASFSSDVITNAVISNVTPTSYDVSLDIELNKNYSDTKYLLSIAVANDSLTAVQSDRVTKIISIGEYFNEFDVEGLLDNQDLTLYQRNFELSEDGFDKLDVIKADLINTRFNFSLVDGEIISITQVTASVFSGDVYIWQNDQVVIDTSDIQIINDSQVVTKTYTSPYPEGIDISINGNETGEWEIVAPYIVPYSELINEFTTSSRPEILYDPSNPNDGFNQDVIYQISKGVNIHMGYLIVMRKDGVDTDYLHLSSVLEIKDFEESLS